MATLALAAHMPQDPLGQPQTGLLELALRTQSVRNKAIRSLESSAGGESLDIPVRFFGHILEWEKTTDAKTKKMVALKIISVYVEKGSLYEATAFLSDKTGKDLLKRRNVTDKKFFANARAELLRFISTNDVLLRTILSVGKGAP